MQDYKSKNTTLLLSLSSFFEYYDFVIYGLMSAYLGALFFPNQDPLVSQLQAFTIFALSYVARPIGGLIFALKADTSSRKKIFIISNVILAFATIGIAILPNYDQLGITAAILLVVLRILQAACFAIELPGAIVLLDESKSNSSKFGFVISGTSLGTILASGSIYLLESNYSREEILNYAWRLPFILGGCLCVVAIFMRTKIANHNNLSISKVFILSNILTQYKKVFNSILILSLPAFLIVMNIMFPSFIPQYYEYEAKEIYLAISISILFGAVYSPAFSYLTQRIERIVVIRVFIAFAIFAGFFINFLLLSSGFSNLVIALFIYQAIICSIMVHIFPLMSKIFTQQSKLTIITVAYNLTYSLIAFAPILVLKLCKIIQGAMGLWLFLTVLAIFILINIAEFDEENHR